MSDDREKAAQYRVKMTAALSSVCRLIDEAKKEGFLISYGTGDGQDGNQVITKIDISMKL